MFRAGGCFGALLAGVETKTLEVNRELEHLAAVVRLDPTLAATFAQHEAGELGAALAALPPGQALLETLQAFMDRYGHREAVISTAFQPTWKDAPEVVLGIIKGLALVKPQNKSKRPAWTDAREELLAHSLFRRVPLYFP